MEPRADRPDARLWHGQKIVVCKPGEGAVTVAKLAGYSGFLWEYDRYADRRWHEYTAGAERAKEMQMTLGNPQLTIRPRLAALDVRSLICGSNKQDLTTATLVCLEQ
jgi:hypothetical protein